jgi:hypothetical protein
MSMKVVEQKFSGEFCDAWLCAQSVNAASFPSNLNSMGRASGKGNASTSALTPVRPRRSVTAVSVDGVDITSLRSTIRDVNAIFPITDEVDAHLGVVSANAQRSVAGARGRLFAALQDIYEAQELALSEDVSDQRLAQTMTDNALWYIGRVLAAADKSDAPYLEELKAVLAQWGEARGGAQLRYLQEQKLLPESISAEEVAQWRAHAGAHYVEAFASSRSFFAKKGQRPVWSALAILERAGRARERLESAPASGYAERLRAKALRRVDTLIKQCHTYLEDIDGSKGTYDAITPFGPQDVTQVEAITQALIDGRTRQLNVALEETGVIARHRQLVAEGTGKDPDSSVIAVSDKRWLAQMSTYAGYGAEQSGDILALNVGKVGIFLTPEVARNMLVAGEAGGFRSQPTSSCTRRSRHTRSDARWRTDPTPTPILVLRSVMSISSRNYSKARRKRKLIT